MLVVTAITLALLDGALILTGLFPPRYDRGDARVGWIAGAATGEQRVDRCIDLESGAWLTFDRNEDGARTALSRTALVGSGPRFEVVVSGDSHTDLCAPNPLTHFGFTERFLDSAGVPSAAYANGAGKYSPLQAYLAIKPILESYRSDAFVLNLYTGNDFYDILRIDDRPFLTRDGETYRVAEPVWYTLDPPDANGRSRVVYAARKAAEAVGIRQLALRLRYLRRTAAEQGEGMSTVFGYMNDLRKSSSDSVGYPQAFSAQMLNQQLFFHHFPQSKDESVRRIQALLRLIREAHPEVVLVLSPIPSYQLVLQSGPDPIFSDVFSRLPITFDGGVAQEDTLYRGLQALADSAGWIFVDNLTALRASAPADSLFNHHDYHITPRASEVIGRQQATALQRARTSRIR